MLQQVYTTVMLRLGDELQKIKSNALSLSLRVEQPGDCPRLRRIDQVGSYIGNYVKKRNDVYRLVRLTEDADVPSGSPWTECVATIKLVTYLPLPMTSAIRFQCGPAKADTSTKMASDNFGRKPLRCLTALLPHGMKPWPKISNMPPYCQAYSEAILLISPW
jgi:hypothetical protein